MAAPAPGSIEHISDTARWVAVYRAMESERPDAIFHDPFARRLAGERGEAIVAAMKRGRQMAWPMIVRTAVFDEVIRETIRGRHADTVVNLAAGLDARPWRLELPADLRWIDVDLPEILAYKTRMLAESPPKCRYETVTADLTNQAHRQALFTQLGKSATRALVITEGLLIYLTAEQVGALSRDLHAAGGFRWWLIDLANPRLLKMMQRMWGRSVQAGAATFQFAPVQGTEFFRTFGWRELEYHSMLDEARRLRREMRGMWLWRLLGRLRSQKVQEEFRRMSGMVLLERD